MIGAYFGISKQPFSLDKVELLNHQQEIYETLKVHSSQGGLCLVMGVPGTGKSILKQAIIEQCAKTSMVVSIARTLHTYHNTIRILCEAFKIEQDGSAQKCERRLIDEAFSLKRQGKSLIIIIDDAHLMEIDSLRKLRLMFEDFPKNHNVILIGQPELLSRISLSVNEDIKSRITYSTVMRRMNPDDMRELVLAEFDRVGLGHNTFDEDALELMIRSTDGVLRRLRNLCISCLLEALRAQTRIVGLKIVNRVLIQPHWRKDYDLQQV